MKTEGKAQDLRQTGVARDHLAASARLKQECAEKLATLIDSTAIEILSALRRGRKLLVCGNGGSAADAQHLSSELTGRFRQHRRGLPAIALTTDSSALSAIGNDYGFDQVYSRQIEALAVPGDVVVVISTSGNSPNILRAAEEARQRECVVIGLTGQSGGKLAELCDHCIMVPSPETALVQEVHGSIVHCWGTVVESYFLED